MRWRKVPRENSIVGLTYIMVKFLWLPYTIKGETRWLEFASIRRRYDGIKFGQFLVWTDLEFVN